MREFNVASDAFAISGTQIYDKGEQTGFTGLLFTTSVLQLNVTVEKLRNYYLHRYIAPCGPWWLQWVVESVRTLSIFFKQAVVLQPQHKGLERENN